MRENRSLTGRVEAAQTETVAGDGLAAPAVPDVRLAVYEAHPGVGCTAAVAVEGLEAVDE